MKTERGILKVLLLIVSILFSTSAVAQGDGGGKKKKKTVKTEQTQSTDTKRKQSTVSRQQHKTESQSQIINNLINNMVYVEGGSFTMGSEDSDAFSDEKPVHRETVGSFSIGKYEVTQREWKAVMGNNPSKFNGDDLPVENVSWNDCQQFIRKLNVLTGRNFRLPTESEWEFAARGGNRSNGYKYSGSNDISNVAWYDGNSGSKTHPVGTKRPNELGLHDMSGNVWEWTSSNWCDDYSKPRNSSFLVNRGGSWGSNARYCRVSRRFIIDSTCRINFLGLRLVF